MKSRMLALLVALLGFNGYAQVKTEKDMIQEIKKMEELIQEELGMVKTYPEKPAYYLQVNKTGCRLLVRVNDIPVGYHFVKDEGQSMLYPIIDFILCVLLVFYIYVLFIFRTFVRWVTKTS